MAFSTHNIRTAFRTDPKVGREVDKPTDIPVTPHWQIQCHESVTRYTGYEATDGPGSASSYFRVFVFTDQKTWQDLAQQYYESLANPGLSAYTVKDDMIFIACSGRMVPKVTVQIQNAEHA